MCSVGDSENCLYHNSDNDYDYGDFSHNDFLLKLKGQRAVAVNSSVRSPKPVSTNDLDVTFSGEHTTRATLIALVIRCHPGGVFKYDTVHYIFSLEYMMYLY